jgi:hypothetical protein
MPGRDGNPATISSDGTTAQINLLLNTSPYSTAALDLAGDDLRQAAHDQAPPGTTALVGGVSSVFADIRDANNRDLWVIFPVAGVLIAVILGLLLRSLVAIPDRNGLCSLGRNRAVRVHHVPLPRPRNHRSTRPHRLVAGTRRCHPLGPAGGRTDSD